jgi:hypothetical protein
MLTFTGDISRADADDVVGVSMLSSAESLVPGYFALDQCVECALCHPLRQCNVIVNIHGEGLSDCNRRSV